MALRFKNAAKISSRSISGKTRYTILSYSKSVQVISVLLEHSPAHCPNQTYV